MSILQSAQTAFSKDESVGGYRANLFSLKDTPFDRFYGIAFKCANVLHLQNHGRPLSSAPSDNSLAVTRCTHVSYHQWLVILRAL